MTTQRFEFEWAIEDISRDSVLIHERLCGTDLENTYGPMKAHIAQSFVRARRDFVHRFITTATDAYHVFEPRVPFTTGIGKPHYDS